MVTGLLFSTLLTALNIGVVQNYSFDYLFLYQVSDGGWSARMGCYGDLNYDSCFSAPSNNESTLWYHTDNWDNPSAVVYFAYEQEINCV